ncbi:MAG: hypothetical protein P8M12_09170 [Flavobacteriales bacterium]|nr:hypothetical protein [Flavobacteriales bacterium]
MKQYILYFALITFMSSCAFHEGLMLNSASLNQANFKYIDYGIEGTATTNHIFGIGGLKKMALVGEAKQYCIVNANLKENQALVNQTINWKMTFFFPVVTTRCTITADIVEFK